MLERLRSGALYTGVLCFVAMLVAGTIAALTRRPYIFPSLGPSAIMLFSSPRSRESAPVNVVGGHAIGAACGYFALWCTHLIGVGFTGEVEPPRVVAAAVALGLTALLMFATDIVHAPAGATTLIVALGFLPALMDAIWLMLGVMILLALALLANRLFKDERGTRP